MSAMPRILAIMGSGELAPTMVSVHRRLTSLLPRPVKAALIDTPFGFQENAPELCARAVEHFAVSVNVELGVAGLERLRDTHISADPVRVERGLRLLEESDYLFAGPGSPTYALRQWAGSRVADVVRDKLEHGGIVVFASAAALTLGRDTVPVYEIYKVGQDVSRLPGLDVLSTIGINAVVIPHYNNAEGGNHDTRFCYLGEERLRLFESMLDDDTYVLGVDEHTGLVIDIDAGTAEVVGNGAVTLRVRGTSTVFDAGATIGIGTLRDPSADAGGTDAGGTDAGGTDSAGGGGKSTGPTAADTSTGGSSSLAGEADRLRAVFDEALSLGDAVGAVRAALDLEQTIKDWSADTLQGPDGDHARATLRAMISALGDAAVEGVRDPRTVLGPLVEALLAVRAAVRAEKRFDLSDLVRDEAMRGGVEIRDTPSGPEWHLREP